MDQEVILTTKKFFIPGWSDLQKVSAGRGRKPTNHDFLLFINNKKFKQIYWQILGIPTGFVFLECELEVRPL